MLWLSRPDQVYPAPPDCNLRSGGPSFRSSPKKKKKRTPNRRLSWLWMNVRVNCWEIEKKRGEVWLHKISNLQNYEIRWHLHIGSILCFERFSTPVFPSPRKPTFQNSNSTRNQVDEEPLCGCATSKSLLLLLFGLKGLKHKTLTH